MTTPYQSKKRKELAKKIINLIDAEYESSSSTTAEFREAYLTFRYLWSQLLKLYGAKAETIDIGHFDIFGFFSKNGKYGYFSVSDFRQSTSTLIRTAKDLKDYTGGRNNFICEENTTRFVHDMNMFFSQYMPQDEVISEPEKHEPVLNYDEYFKKFNTDTRDMDYNVRERGGSVGMYTQILLDNYYTRVKKFSPMSQKLISILPNRLGCYCDYLGGGVRDGVKDSLRNVAVQLQEHISNKTIRKDVTEFIIAFVKRCREIYSGIEDNLQINEEEYPDGDTNWNAVATNAVRGTSN